MGAGCLALLDANIQSGIDTMLQLRNFEDQLEGTDIVITGGGRIDSQSIQGKVISVISKYTCIRNIPLVAIVGYIDDSAIKAYDLGVTAMFSIDRMALPFSESAKRSAKDYKHTLQDVLRLIRSLS